MSDPIASLGAARAAVDRLRGGFSGQPAADPGAVASGAASEATAANRERP